MSIFDNRVPGLAGLSLLKAIKHFSPEEIDNTLRRRNVGNPQEIIASALQQICASRAVPRYFQGQKPLSHRKVQHILELFTHLEQPYGGALLHTYLVQLKKDLKRALVDIQKRNQIYVYVEEMLTTALLSSRTSTFFNLFNVFFNDTLPPPIPLFPYLKIACETGNTEVVAFVVEQLYPSQYNSSDQKKLTIDQQNRLKAVRKSLLNVCKTAIKEGTLCTLFPIFEKRLLLIFKDQTFLTNLLNYAAKNGDEDLVKLLVAEKGATSEVAIENAYKSGFEKIANYLKKESSGSDESSNVKVEIPQKSDPVSFERFVISGVVDLKQLNDFLQSTILERKLSFEEREQILRMFFSSEEWKPLIPLRQRDQQRVLAILDAQKGNIPYRNKCIDHFVKQTLRTAVGSFSEGLRLLFILLASEHPGKNDLLNNIINRACQLGQKEIVSTYLDLFKLENRISAGLHNTKPKVKTRADLYVFEPQQLDDLLNHIMASVYQLGQNEIMRTNLDLFKPKKKVRADLSNTELKEKKRADLYICKPQQLNDLLTEAIIHDHVEIVKLLVNAGAPINQSLGGVAQPSAISLAIEFENEEMVEYFLRKAAEMEIVIDTKSLGKYPLDYAFLKGNSKIITYLQGHCTSIPLIDQCAAAIKCGNTALAMRFLRKIKAVNQPTKKYDFLHLVAIKHGRFAILHTLIHEHKADLDKGRLVNDSQTSLILAAKQKNPRILPYLISMMGPKTVERDKQQALIAAVKYRRASNISCLLENGAIVDRAAINWAIKKGIFVIFRQLLAHMGSAMTETDNAGNTLLHTIVLEAKWHSSASIFAYLLVQKPIEEANLMYVQNNEGKTPLQLALDKGEFDNRVFIELLLKVDAALKPENYVHDPKARETATTLIGLLEAENKPKKLDEPKKLIESEQPKKLDKVD
jgi:ankyrin repeat protein